MGTLVFQATLGGAINLIGPNTASTVNFTLPSADGTSGQALTTNGSGTLAFGTLAVGAGGTGLTSTPANGALDIGNGTGFTRTTLTAGTNVTITNSSGGITIAAAGGTSQWTTSGSDIYYNTGKVGVGTTSPLQGTLQVGTYGSGSSSIAVASGTAGTGSIFFGDGSTGTDYYRGYIQYDHATDNLLFASALNIGMRMDSNGNPKIAQSISVGNATPTNSGAGVTFPATQSASTDANTLDDYEEGTWTPTTPNNGYVFSTVSGKYTKIGNVVYISFTVVFSTIGSTNSACVFQGLPFAKGTAGTGACREGSTTGAIYMVASSGSTYVELNSMDGVANGTNRTIRVSEEYICSYFYYV